MLQEFVPTVPFERFDEAALPALHKFTEWRAACLDRQAPDCAFHHAPDHFVDVMPRGISEGAHWFGPGRSVNDDMDDNRLRRVKAVTSVALGGAILSPASMAVLSPNRGFFAPSISNLSMWQGRLSLADPNFVEIDDSRHAFAPGTNPIPFIDAIALPVGGIGISNYGHFLYDGLPAAAMHRLLLGPEVRLAGPPLTSWQTEILDALGLATDYLPITEPARFAKVVTSDMIAFNGQYPSRFVRGLFDRLRFRFGHDGPRNRRLMISRNIPGNTRTLGNRTEIEAIAITAGFEIVQPAGMSVLEQAQLFASAEAVIGESGAALANLGFCDPGTRVLEIQPDQFVDGWTRAASAGLGHDWHVLFGVVAPGGSVREFRYEVDPGGFQTAVATVFGGKN